MISKSLSTSQRFTRLFTAIPDLAEFAQSLYPLMVSHADDFGREQGDVLTIKYRVHPMSPRSEQDFTRALEALDQVGLIRWYTAQGRQCYQIERFDDHQTGLHKRTRSAFPAFPGKSRKVPEVPGQLKGTKENLTELNLTEGKGTEGRARDTDADLPPLSDVPPVWSSRGLARGGLVESHRACLSLTAAACARGMCVPAFLVQREWLPQVEHREADIRAFIQGVLARTPDGPLGDPPLDFWRAAWKAQHGSQAPRRLTRNEQSIADAGAIIRQLEGGK